MLFGEKNKKMIYSQEFLLKNALRLKAFFLDLIFPVECLLCGRPGLWLCRDCFRRIKFSGSQFCLACKKKSDFGEFCPECGENYFLDGVLVACDHSGETLTILVKNLKYLFLKDVSSELGRFLALFMRDQINKSRLGGSEKKKRLSGFLNNFKNNLIMPVPLHPRRLRWRGFNQAELIAESLSGYLGLAVDSENLKKTKNTKAQAKLNKKQRQENVRDCFSWTGPDLSGQNIILVDDVATTGSTLNECARVLKANGAGEVWGLVLTNG